MIIYLAFGLGFYIGLSLKDPQGFVKASLASLLRGLLLGIFFWPIGLIVQTYFSLNLLKRSSEVK
jgi:hypothetical protein